jgi:uncharacterized membrane protein YgaE (UPF0421/DUF939 family)
LERLLGKDEPVATESASPVSARWWERNELSRRSVGAFKTALAAVLCLWLGHLFHLERSYWASVTAIVMMGSENAVSLAACRDRLIGTAIGAVLGWVTVRFWHGHSLVYGLAVLLCLLACSTLKFEKAGRLAAVALTIIVLIQWDGGPAYAALSRFSEVALGIIVALTVGLVVFPERPVELANKT